MAEAAGLAVGAVALVGLVENCIRLFDYIHAADAFGSSADVLCVRLDIQKLRLLHWIKRVRFLQSEYDKQLDEHNTCAAVRRTLECLHNLLDVSDTVRTKHGLLPSEGSDDPHDFLSASRSKDLFQQIRDLKLTDRVRAVPKSSLLKVTWAVKDEERFSALVGNVRELVDGLYAVVPDDDYCMSRLLSREDIQRVDDPGLLNLTVTAIEATKVRDKKDAVAEEAFIKQAEDRVLDALWFHEMGARRASINPAYARTFEWALSPGSAICCSLPDWLSSGSGAYWVQGKPGSGKVRLPKRPTV